MSDNLYTEAMMTDAEKLLMARLREASAIPDFLEVVVMRLAWMTTERIRTHYRAGVLLHDRRAPAPALGSMGTMATVWLPNDEMAAVEVVRTVVACFVDGRPVPHEHRAPSYSRPIGDDET